LDEIIDIVTAKGKPTGKTALKSVIHKEGHFHNTAHIWFYTKKGEILLSQRAANKVICPLLWDVSVAGHIDSGETITSGAVREIKEEIGLTISEGKLNKIGVFECFQKYSNGIIDNEFHHTFIAELPVNISELKRQEEEVEDLQLVTFEAFKTHLQHSETTNYFVATNKSYYKFVLQTIKNTLTF
jgi:isopentenyldiphosphate isomerase